MNARAIRVTVPPAMVTTRADRLSRLAACVLSRTWNDCFDQAHSSRIGTYGRLNSRCKPIQPTAQAADTGEAASAGNSLVNSTPTSLPRRQMSLHCLGVWPTLDRCKLNCSGRLSISTKMSLAPFSEISTSLHRSRRELLCDSIQAGKFAV
jgi:hypothetical protein